MQPVHDRSSTLKSSFSFMRPETVKAMYDISSRAIEHEKNDRGRLDEQILICAMKNFVYKFVYS